MLYKSPDLALSGTGIYMQQAGKRLSRVEVEMELEAGGWEGCYGDAVVQTQECTHVSEQLLAVEEGALPRQADWLLCVCTYLDAV